MSVQRMVRSFPIFTTKWAANHSDVSAAGGDGNERQPTVDEGEERGTYRFASGCRKPEI
jgi:hypothetical protein